MGLALSGCEEKCAADTQKSFSTLVNGVNKGDCQMEVTDSRLLISSPQSWLIGESRKELSLLFSSPKGGFTLEGDAYASLTCGGSQHKYNGDAASQIKREVVSMLSSLEID